MDPSLRNYDLLMNSARRLMKSGLDFTVTVIGWSANEDMIPKDIRPCFDFKGRVSYKEMYSLVEKSDYILMLLDDNCIGHKQYKEDIVSGNVQLSYGFKKPVLIAEEFAELYKFNKKNSLVYSDNDLFSSMVTALKMTPNEYSGMQKELENTVKEVYEKSLKNLKKLVKQI